MGRKISLGMIVVASAITGSCGADPPTLPQDASSGVDDSGATTSGAAQTTSATTTSAEATGGAPTGSSSSSGDTTGATTSGVVETGTDTGSGSTSTATGTGGGTDSTGSAGTPMFFPCTTDDECADPAAECCVGTGCFDTCAIPCNETNECPLDLTCAHDYCLASCNRQDADCAQFPGYTCQHAGTLCEV